MEVFKKSLSAAFATDRRYVIPQFQRPYVWNLEHQWEPMWADIVNRAEHEAESEQPGNTQEVAVHFFGAIVIQQQKTWGDHINAHDVIDGQQRLTTFQILLAALRDVAVERGDQTRGWFESYTTNKNVLEDVDVERFKVWPTSRDRVPFERVMTASSPTALNAHYPRAAKGRPEEPRIVEAYRYFHRAASEWLNDPSAPGVTAADRLKLLRKVIDRRLQIVSIELGDQEDPQAIFETLNARGVPLQASDLLRNNIFQRAGDQRQQDLLHQKYWSRFEVPVDSANPDSERFWETEIRQGRLFRPRLDLFMQTYLSLQLGRDVLATRLFQEYKDWIRDKKPFKGDVEVELVDLCDHAAKFERLLKENAEDPVGAFGIRLRVLEQSGPYPLVLAALDENRVSSKARDQIFSYTESFLVRRIVCRVSSGAKSYSRLFLGCARAVRDNPDDPAGAVRRFLSSSVSPGVRWPDDDAFAEAWARIDAYTELKPMRVQMILRRLNEYLDTAHAEKINIQSDLTVEHVMPQNWEAAWPLPAGVDTESARRNRNELLHDFGNLTLLTHGLNASVGNGPAAAKLEAVAKQSKLPLNSHFQGRSTWTEDDIRERSRRLFDIARKVWPPPEPRA